MTLRRVLGWNENGLDIFDRVNVHERRPTGKLFHFGDEIACSLIHDRSEMAQPQVN
jgi:hypothetical protein